MKDIQLPTRVAYVSKLTDLGLTVYEMDAVPDEANAPYVIIGDTDSNEISNKTDFGHTLRILLDIVTEFPKNVVGGSKGADLIANQILGIINSKTKFIINEDLQSVNVKLIQDRKLNGVTDTTRVFRRLLRFEHIIKQIN
ncbi:MAG: hypothetical protein J7577_00875 [Sphingobacteriaceae bacterium]|nr:hypothetical protein [Sphingobacteriaceae bacterium]